MTRVRLTCPCGHAWDHESDGPVPADVRQICPVCNPGLEGTLAGKSVAALALLTQPPGLGPGRVMGDFEILEEINRGGMGVIYKARQKGLNRLVALKVIMPGRIGNPEALRRFKKEVQAAALLSHENIVRVYATDLEAPWPYLAMEYVPGIDLLRLVRQAGPVPVTDALYYIRQAAEGLQHAHEQGLVHRDIKPANIMVSPSPLVAPTGQSTARLPRVKILDMGLARVIGPADVAEAHDATQAGIFLGTPDYVSPEQAEDSRRADIRSDIYSLGGTLYYILTGQVPFPGNSVVAKLRRQMTEPPPSAAAARADVPADVDALVRRLMTRDPAGRPQTPAELIEELNRVMQSGLFAVAGGITPTGLSLGSGLHSKAGLDTQSVKAKAPAAASARGHDGGIHSIALSADGAVLLTGGLDGTIKVWNPARLRETRTLAGDLGSVEQLAVAPGGKWVAGCSVKLSVQDMGVQIWDLATGAARRKLRGPGDNIRCVAIGAEGRRVAAGSADASIWVWTLDPPGTKPVCLLGHAGQVTGVAFSRSGETLLSAGSDGTIRQWDLRAVMPKAALDVRIGPIAGLAFSPSAKRVAVAGRGGLVVRQPDGSLVRCDGHEGPVNAVAFSADGKLVASGGADGTVRVWNPVEGVELASFEGHPQAVWTVAFGPAGNVLYSGGEDGTLRRWPVTVTAE